MKHALLLLAGFILLQLTVCSYFDPAKNPVGLGSDGYEYWHLSSSILDHRGFTYTDPKFYPLFKLQSLHAPIPQTIPCTVRVPGYPYLLAALRQIWDSPTAAIILNELAYVGICIYGFLLSDLLLLGNPCRWLYNILLVLSPIYFTRWGIGSDMCAGFFITAFTYHMIKKETMLSCVWAVLASLTRANLLIYTGLLALLNLRRQGLVVICILAIALGGWMLRNKTLTDHWALSTQNGFVLHTVHLVYRHKDNDQHKIDLFAQSLNQGKTFNQTEKTVDDQLKTLVVDHFRHNPKALLKEWADGVRTLFLFSYFDISDVIKFSRKSLSERLKFVNSSSSDYRHGRLFQLSRVYKWAVALGFFAFPILLLFRKIEPTNKITAVYLATLTAVLVTAFYTGAGGDRLRLPFNAPILIYAVLFWSSLKTFLKKS